LGDEEEPLEGDEEEPLEDDTDDELVIEPAGAEDDEPLMTVRREGFKRDRLSLPR
jgi:hypothetical protein